MAKKIGAFLLMALSFLTVEAKTVSDTLVQNLSCQNLNVPAIYKAIRQDAFSKDYHIPQRNWSFSYLAGCWSLSHTQRLLYMLGHVGSNGPLQRAQARMALDHMRGSTPEFQMNEASEYQVVEYRLRDYEMLPLDQKKLTGSQVWNQLVHGWTESMGTKKLVRSFKNEIEVFQFWRFHQPGNIEMGLGSWARPASENKNTVALLLKNLSERKLTLINLRADQTVQHVVVVKSYTTTNTGDLVFKAYDSNFPDRENHFIYSTSESQFYAHEIMGPFYDVTYLPRAVGAYIVDEKERALIDRALLAHYKETCR